MKSIRRGQFLIIIMLLLFLLMFGILIYKLQHESAFYISHASGTSLGNVFDRNGDILFDPNATAEQYGQDYFLDIGNLIGDDSKQMTNTLVAQNKGLLANFSFMLGEQKNGHASIQCTLDHNVNRMVYDAFGRKNGCAIAYNYKTGEIYVCLSKPSVNILNHYSDIDSLEKGSLLCSVFYPTVPGSTQKIATTISALEHMGYDKLMSKQYDCTGSYTNLSDTVIKCHHSAGHGMQNIVDAFANSCNPFFAQLVEDPDWTLADIEETYRKMGYCVNSETDQTYLNINGISAYTASTSLTNKNDFNTQWGCMGQGTTLASPLQIMTWQSAIANSNGISTMPYLIDHATTVSGEITAQAMTQYTAKMFTDESAGHMREIMLQNGRKRYSNILPDTNIGVKSGTAQIGNAKTENSLLTGFVDDEEFPIAFCIVIDVSRSFQLPELKLLADAVASSRFLTEKKAKQLIQKIGSLGSPYETKQIERQIYVANRTKAINERIYLNVDAIHRAITENKKISFRYFKYNVEKKKKYSPDLHICSPYALTWDDERYYLVAHYDKYPDKMTNFRVDRMESVQLLDEPSQKLPKGFSLKEYLSSTFSMFSGTSQDIQLRFENELVSAVIDRFGTDVKLYPDGDTHFTVTVKVKAEQPFFGWLFGFGTSAQILQPAEIREKYVNMLKEVLANSTK